MAAILECPEQNMSILAGSIVRLGRFSEIEWMVAYGWYTWGGNRPVCGWYLMQCDAPSTIKPLQAIDLVDIYVITEPEPGPMPPHPGAHITEEEKELYDRAFITIDSYLDLPNLQGDDLHDGKLVRVQHLEDDSSGYFIWDVDQNAWVSIDFGDNLPTPTSDDIGKMLGVDENQNYSLISPILPRPEVTYSATDVGSGTYILDEGKLLSNIFADIDAGKDVTLLINNTYLKVAQQVDTTYVMTCLCIINDNPYILYAAISNVDVSEVPVAGKQLATI